MLVAPVLDPGLTARDVVLPPGEWISIWTGQRHVAGTIQDYPAPCPGIPVFVRAGRPALAAALQAAARAIARGSVPSGVTTATYTAGLDRDLKVSG